MENLLRNENTFKTARSPPTDPQGTPSKRRKLDTLDSSTVSPSKSPHVKENDWTWKRLRTHFRTKLSHIETSTTQLQYIRKQMETLWETEAKKLEIQAKDGIETLEILERHLNIENTPHDPLELQTPAEVDISPIKTPMKQKLLNLLPQNTRLKEHIIFSDFGGISTSPDTPNSLEHDGEAQIMTEKLIHESIIKSKKNLRENVVLPPQYPYEKNQSQKCMVKIEKLNTEKIFLERRQSVLAKAARVNDLEKELQSSRDIISTLREAVKDKILLEQQVSGLTKALECAEIREQKLRARCEELSSRVEDYESKSSASKRGKVQRRQGVRKCEGDEQRKDMMEYVKVELITDESISNNSIDVNPIDIVGDEPMNHEVIQRNSNDKDEIPPDDASDDTQEETGDAKEPEKFKKKKKILQDDSGEKQKVAVGNFHLFPSSSNFFDIDFQAKYVRENAGKYICTSCKDIHNTRPKIIDHVWSTHHQGQWHCPHCTYSSKARYSVIGHMKKQHRGRK